MSYFGGSSRMAGDPGFFGTLGGIFKRAIRTGVALTTGGPIAALKVNLPRGRPSPFGRPLAGGGVPAIGGGRPVAIDPRTGMPSRRRRMNVGNAKALRRAIRRTDGFVRLAKSALKNTGFKIVSKSSGRVSRATMDKAVAAAHHRGR